MTRLEIATQLQRPRGRHLPPPPASHSLFLVLLDESQPIPERLPSLQTHGALHLGIAFKKVFISCPGKWVLLLDNYTQHTCSHPFLGKEVEMTSQPPRLGVRGWPPTTENSPADPSPPRSPMLLPVSLHRSPQHSQLPWALTWQALHFMNMTLRGESPSQQPPNYVITVIKELKEELGGETPLELQPDCDWCVPISVSVLSLWMARTASGL